MAWMPPYVAHVPTAMIAVAFGARRSSHSLVVRTWPVSGSLPKPQKYPPLSLVELLVGDRALDDEDERLEFAAVGLVPPLDEGVRALLGPALEVDQRPVHRDLRQSGQRAERRSPRCSAGSPRSGRPSHRRSRRPPFIQRMWTAPSSSSGCSCLAVPLSATVVTEAHLAPACGDIAGMSCCGSRTLRRRQDQRKMTKPLSKSSRETPGFTESGIRRRVAGARP